MQEEELGTFYLTDFLARHFESLVVRPFKLDTHPELLPMMFGNYKRLVYLAQTDDADLRQRAEAAAAFLGLEFEQRRTGYGELQPSLVRFVERERRMPELTVIFWRDIPAQVTAGKGRGAARAAALGALPGGDRRRRDARRADRHRRLPRGVAPRGRGLRRRPRGRGGGGGRAARAATTPTRGSSGSSARAEKRSPRDRDRPFARPRRRS